MDLKKQTCFFFCETKVENLFAKRAERDEIKEIESLGIMLYGFFLQFQESFEGP